MGYHHFSIAERGQLDTLYRLNWTTRQIAVHLGRHHATIARELCIITRQYHSKPCIGGCTEISFIL